MVNEMADSISNTLTPPSIACRSKSRGSQILMIHRDILYLRQKIDFIFRFFSFFSLGEV